MTPRAAAVALVLAGAGAALLAGTQPWVGAAVEGVPGTSRVEATAAQAAPGVPALALVAVAGAVVLLTAGRLVRVAVAVLLLLGGIGVGVLAAGVVAAPGTAVRPAVTQATGTLSGTAAQASLTAWPWVAVAGGSCVAAGGALAVLRRRQWPDPSRRYERPAGTAQAGTAQAGTAPAAATQAGTARAGRDRAADDWDRISRGEDPTGS